MWNYRFVKGVSDSDFDPEGLECTLCEVYYEDDEPMGIVANPEIVSDSCDPKDMLELQAMLDVAFDSEVLIYPEEFKYA